MNSTPTTFWLDPGPEQYTITQGIVYAFSVVIYINTIILTLSTLWALYFIQKIRKDYKIEKMQSKLRNNYPEHYWLNAMKNFKSNRIRNILLLAICTSEIVMTALLVYNKFNTLLENSWLYENVGYSIVMTFIGCGILSYNIFATYSFAGCVITFLFRILTQYMVYQYSYYKPYLNLKLELYISITCFIALIFLVAVFYFYNLFITCCLFLLIYEFIQCALAGRKLCFLLGQCLYDAIRHENQNKFVIFYYKIAHREYRICFAIMLVAIFFQNSAIFLIFVNLNSPRIIIFGKS